MSRLLRQQLLRLDRQLRRVLVRELALVQDRRLLGLDDARAAAGSCVSAREKMLVRVGR